MASNPTYRGFFGTALCGVFCTFSWQEMGQVISDMPCCAGVQFDQDAKDSYSKCCRMYSVGPRLRFQLVIFFFRRATLGAGERDIRHSGRAARKQ